MCLRYRPRSRACSRTQIGRTNSHPRLRASRFTFQRRRRRPSLHTLCSLLTPQTCMPSSSLSLNMPLLPLPHRFPCLLRFRWCKANTLNHQKFYERKVSLRLLLSTSDHVYHPIPLCLGNRLPLPFHPTFHMSISLSPVSQFSSIMVLLPSAQQVYVFSSSSHHLHSIPTPTLRLLLLPLLLSSPLTTCFVLPHGFYPDDPPASHDPFLPQVPVDKTRAGV